MGGAVKAIKKAVNISPIDPVVKAIAKEENKSKVMQKLQELYEVSNRNIYNLGIEEPFVVARDLIRGEGFNATFKNSIDNWAEALQNEYRASVDDVLGVDDGKFLGIKGGIFENLGAAVRDFSYEHATQTIGIAVIVAAIIISILIPPAYGFASGVVLVAFEAGVTSTIALMSIYYIALYAVSFGVSALLSGIIDAAILAMYGDFAEVILENIFFFEKGQELLRITTLTAILDGTIFDRFAGGVVYNSQFAGGIYYDASTCANLNISVGGDFSLTPHAISTQFGWIDTLMKNLPGDENFSVLKM